MFKTLKEKNISKFSNDSKKFGGYIYTSSGKYSSILANKRLTDITLSMVKIKGKDVFDIGCGDGTYTYAIFKYGKPKSIYAIDPAIEAIKMARKNNISKNIKFDIGNIYKLPKGKKFDIAIVRGVLHHLYNAEEAIKEISKVAKKVLVIEPNGYNPLLKVIERLSKYHVDHEEKSYSPHKINQWIEKYKGKIRKLNYVGLVPFFCPDIIAKILKNIEPIIEKIPIVNKLFCSVYCVVYEIK